MNLGMMVSHPFRNAQRLKQYNLCSAFWVRSDWVTYLSLLCKIDQFLTFKMYFRKNGTNNRVQQHVE